MFVSAPPPLHLSNCQRLGRQQQPGGKMEEAGESLKLLLGRSRWLVDIKTRLLGVLGSKQRLKHTLWLMSEVVHANDLSTVCTVCSSRWCLAMKYSLCRMRTLWVTPQWGSMGPTCGRVSNGWKEWVLMMQFVCNGWMSLFQKVVRMRWSPEVGVPKETMRMVLLYPLAFCWFADSTVVRPKLCVSMWGVGVYFYLPVSALKELNRFVEEIGKQRNNC